MFLDHGHSYLASEWTIAYSLLKWELCFTLRNFIYCTYLLYQWYCDILNFWYYLFVYVFCVFFVFAFGVCFFFFDFVFLFVCLRHLPLSPSCCRIKCMSYLTWSSVCISLAKFVNLTNVFKKTAFAFVGFLIAFVCASVFDFCLGPCGLYSLLLTYITLLPNWIPKKMLP